MLIIDAHLDMAMNAVEWNRDYTCSVQELREREIEKNLTDKRDRGKGTVSLPELRKGKIGLVVATQLARVTERGSAFDGWYSPAQAWAMTQAQLAWYQAMTDLGEMVQITDYEGLTKHLALWENTSIPDETKPVGFILSLEGADSLVNLSYLEKAYGYGLRALGPAWYGPGRYASGTATTDGLTAAGKDLLREMDALGIILDATHLTDKGFDEALSIYKGTIWASHHNCRTLVPHQRQLSDEQILRLVERGAVIGGALDAWMMAPGFVQRQSDPKEFGVTMDKLVDHWDHICQLTGNSLHVAFGTDLDGMFGREQSPYDLDTISDLQKYQDLLRQRGYAESDIENIFHKNWLRLLEKTWRK
ncbi:membrane dipeptidase [Runella defluvii]|uniref:Membrane dipeptidase n=1 Tax=Runella defluvii TaxID=370973 RepID=A0A7W5ZP59_9BACT|nr:membrane dipeptidase [Runella defluvii]MBB3840205.1 membrane dipeptidase [Runella defluvii]